YSPRFSPDGGELVFVGVKNGFSDIYVVGTRGGEPERLTYDMYEDRDPAFSPSGDTVVFVSDRPDAGQEWIPGRYALWLRDGQGRVRRLTERAGFVGYPVFSSGGDYLFYVAADSAQNIYVLSMSTGRVVRRTGFIGEVSHLSLSKDDRKLAFAYYSNVGWDIALISDPLDVLPADTSLPTGYEADMAPFEKSGLDLEEVKPVGFSLSLDYAAGAAAYSPGTASGASGTVYLGFSDILGNHQFGVYTDLYGDILNSNAVVQYSLLPYRVDWGFTAFQLVDVPYYQPGAYLVQRVDRGLQAAASYPFDRFMRVEAMLTGYASEVAQLGYNGGWYLDTLYHQGVSYGTGAFVYDNTFWDSHGPARGIRLRLEGSSSLVSARLFQWGYCDVRNYVRIGRRYVLASMLRGTASFGRDRDLFYLGGELVRGYDYGEFYTRAGPGIGLGSLELRYPFIDRLKLAFPLPIDIKNIRGVAFLDAGVVVRDSMRLWDVANRQLEDLKLGAGAGLRIQVSVFYLKFDFGKPLSATADKGWKFIFGLGTDF
ncbi:MAG: BamA/TamA family outer membrane protein, partial [candidate division WOR-3 bacterium]